MGKVSTTNRAEGSTLATLPIRAVEDVTISVGFPVASPFTAALPSVPLFCPLEALHAHPGKRPMASKTTGSNNNFPAGAARLETGADRRLDLPLLLWRRGLGR